MPRFSQKNKNPKNKKTLGISGRVKMIRAWISSKMNRRTFANLLMICFIIFTSIGAGMIFLPAGLVVAGVTSGFFGFLLGLE